MTLEDAFRELGLAPGADADTLRRTYLRLIKVRKPESDPEGFQRAREAYETARAAGAWQALAHARVADEETAAPAAAAGAPSPGEADKPTPAQPTAEDTIFGGFLVAWRGAGARGTRQERLDVAREAVAALPRDPRAHWLLVNTLVGWYPDVELAKALRAGHAAGWPEFLEALLIRLPSWASRDEVGAALASDRPQLKLAGAAVAARWTGGREAADVVVASCRELAEGRGSDIPIGGLLDVTLALHESGAVAAAGEAQAALRAFVEGQGSELEIVNGVFGGAWTLAQELSTLPAEFPQPLRRALAAGARAGDLTTAFYDTCAVVRLDPSPVRSWARQVVPHAPNVAQILSDALAVERNNRRATWGTRAGMVVPRLLVFPILMMLIRGATSSDCNGSDSDEPSLGAQISTTVAPPATAGPNVRMVYDAMVALCDDPNGQVCRDAQLINQALMSGDCVAIRPRLESFRSFVSRATSDEARFLTRATLAAWQTCGSAGTPP